MPSDKKSETTFAVIADLQYCDAIPFKNRFYRNSIDKLKSTLNTINERKLDFVVNLGDIIDRDWTSYERILPVFNNFQSPVYHVLGNHDYEVCEDQKALVPSKIGTQRYYHFSHHNWRFIVLDGNEISTFANLPGSDNFLQAEKWLLKMEKEQKINGKFWNGGVGEKQMFWLKSILEQAEQNHEKVIIFCHYPIFPPDKHNLLDNELLLTLLKNYKSVKMWINGHNHKGNYGLFEDIHFVNVKGMVEGENDVAWSIFNLYENEISIKGYGTEISTRLFYR